MILATIFLLLALVAGCVRACAFVAVWPYLLVRMTLSRYYNDSLALLWWLVYFLLSELIYVNENDSSATTASRLLWQCAIPPVVYASSLIVWFVLLPSCVMSMPYSIPSGLYLYMQLQLLTRAYQTVFGDAYLVFA